MPFLRLLASAVLLAGFLPAQAASPPTVPVDVLFADPTIDQVQISPNGRYLALLSPLNDRMNLRVIDRQTGQQKWLTNMAKESVVAFEWLKEERILFAQQWQGQESFGFYAVDADGSDLTIISQATILDENRSADVTFLGQRILHRLPDDPRMVIAERSRGGASGLNDVVRLDTFSGRATPILNNPGRIRRWIPDHQGVVRVGVTNPYDGDLEVRFRRDERSEWETIAQFSFEDVVQFEGGVYGDGAWTPLAFHPDNRTLLVRSFKGHDRGAIYRYDPIKREKLELIYEHPYADAGGSPRLEIIPGSGGVLFSEDGKSVAGVYVEGERPMIHWLTPEGRELQTMLDEVFPGTFNTLTSRTKDGKLAVVFTRSDRNPGEYFLFDREALTVEKIGSRLPAVDPKQMAEIQPIRFKARDGAEIFGYLTLPVGREPRKLPVIVHPHGGPWARDTWRFQPEVQLYANRGFAVLQVNFRGGTGFGVRYLEAGFKGWGGRMQEDIVDGLRWLIGEGIADPGRVGVSGASFGGFSVLAQMVFYPEHYRFGINYVGATDLTMRARPGMGARAPKAALSQMARLILDPLADAELLERTNPINFIERLPGPLLNGYGRNDPRVVIEDWDRLERQLKRYNKPYEIVVETKEGHGFRNRESRISWYSRVDRFLAERLDEMNRGVVTPGELRDVRPVTSDN